MKRLVLFAALVLALLSGLIVPAAGQEADPIPTLAVTPSTDLVDGQVVTVSGAGWSPHDGVGVSLCGADESVCPVPTQWIDADGAGAFSTEVRVRAAYTADGRSTDCRAEPCSFRANQSPAAVAAPVAFDAGGPLVPPPVLTVSPFSDDLVDGDEVEVAGTGFFPFEEVIVAQCFAGASNLEVPWCGSIATTADASGSLTDSRRVRDRIYAARSEHDCRGTPSSCPITAAAASPPYRVRATVGIGLRPEGRERVTADPTTGLRTGQTVDVRASGLNGNHEAAVGQCYVDTEGREGTCLDRVRSVTVGRGGTLRESVVVRRTWRDAYADHTVDCTVDHCYVLVAGDAVTLDVGPSDDFGPSNAVEVPLSFAADPAPASPTAVTPAFAG